jgi:hypothetical protein
VPAIDEKRFQAAIKSILEGTYSIERLKESFSLTEGQIDILNAL